MTEEEVRPVVPRTESHQSLANNPATSRPLPPRRNRASQLRSASVRSQSSQSNSSAVDKEARPSVVEKEVYEAADDGDVNDGSTNSDARYGSLVGENEADLYCPMDRTVSSGSARSYNSRLDTKFVAEEIPKEEIELALQGLSRDDLVIALGRAKVQMDEIDAKLDEQILASEELQASSNSLLSQLNLSEAENDSLNAVIRQREERIDDLMADQDRMESEIYSKMQVIESLRKQLNESEKRRNDAERRYADQSSTMDKERQFYVDSENVLKSQKATQAASYEKLLSQHHELYKEHERLTTKLSQLRAQGAFGSPSEESDEDGDENEDDANGDAAVDGETSAQNEDGPAAKARKPRLPGRRVSGKQNSRTLAEEKELETLKEELVTIQRSHTSITEAMATLQTELKDVKAENTTLRDQNETFIDILQEKTFSGALLSESAMFSAGIGRHRLRGGSGLMGPYESDEDEDDEDDRDDDEEDDDTREGDTTGNTSVDNVEAEADDDDVDDVPDTPKAPVTKAATTKTSGRNVRRRKQSTSILAPHPTDLASELEQSGSPSEQAQLSPDEKKRRQERRNERHGTVSDNVEELQKEVRELREANQALTLYIAKIIDRIIAREGYENILAVDGKGTVRGTRRKQSRPNLRAGLYDTFENPNQTKRSVSAASAASAATTSSSGSGVGVGLFRFGSGSSANNTDGTAKNGKAAPPKPKRGSSIDWSKLPFLGGGGNSNNAEPNPNLKPLTLQSTSPLIGSGPPSAAARKVRTSEEVEDEADVAERERIRNELLARGIKPPSHQLVQSPSSPSKAFNGTARTRAVSTGAGAGGFAAFFSRVVTGGGNTSADTTMPNRSQDATSDISTTPGSRITSYDSTSTRSRSGTVGASGEVFPRTSTPILSDPEKRKEERNRAIQLSGSGLTEFGGTSGGEGKGGAVSAAARARARARRDRTAATLAAAANGGGLNFDEGEYEDADGTPTSSTGTPAATSGYRSVSGESSQSGGGASFIENSIAGDESYSLPPPPAMAGGGVEGVSPLLGRGSPLPPLPSMTTGDEKEIGDEEQQQASAPNAGGWKRALRRISILGSGGSPATVSSPLSPTGIGPGQSPTAATADGPEDGAR